MMIPAVIAVSRAHLVDSGSIFMIMPPIDRYSFKPLGNTAHLCNSSSVLPKSSLHWHFLHDDEHVLLDCPSLDVSEPCT